MTPKKTTFFLVLCVILMLSPLAHAYSYSFLFGIPDHVIIGNDEKGIEFWGRIINNGNHSITINGGGTGPDPYQSSPYPWWTTNFWDYNIQGSLANIKPGETRDFRLGIFRDDPLINREYTYLWSFFIIADLNGDGSHDIGTPYQYWDSYGWLYEEMAQTWVSFGDTSYLSSNYYYVQSSLSPTFNPQVPVYEPPAMLLLGLGLLGLVGMRRKVYNLIKEQQRLRRQSHYPDAVFLYPKMVDDYRLKSCVSSVKLDLPLSGRNKRTGE